jgi:hypothetical protein
VDDEVLAESQGVGHLGLQRKRHTRVAAHVPQLLLLAQMTRDDVVAVEADPDDRDLRTSVAVERDEVRERGGLEHGPSAVRHDAHDGRPV